MSSPALHVEASVWRPRPGWARWSAVAIAGVLLSWVFAMPRHAGPDEPSHAVASAAIVRGGRDGVDADLGYSATAMDVPGFIGSPNPGCFAFASDQPASCAGSPSGITADVPQPSRSTDYPVWGLVLPGLASFVPSPTWYAYLARILGALVPWALLALSVRRITSSRTPWAGLGLALGLTPIAWSTMSIINPSSMAIAGAVALWTALLVGANARRTDWLAVAGWAALVLPRRDGPMWATLVVLLVAAVTRTRPRHLVPLGRPGAALVILTSLAAFQPVLAQDWSAFDLLLAAAPLAVVAADLAAPAVSDAVRARLHGRSATRVWLASAVVAVVVALAAVNVLRSKGPDFTLTQRVVAATGEHLRQWVGVLGWLDTPTPEVARAMYWATLGALAVLGALHRPRLVAGALAGLALAVVTAWVLELGSGNTSGTYWQGRYSVPLAFGVPLLAAAGAGTWPTRPHLEKWIGGGIWVMWNLAFADALRRWSVGLSGTINPARWDVATAPLPTQPLVLVHAAASFALVMALLPDRRPEAA